MAIQNGNVYAWGDNASDDLGNGGTASSNVPVLVLDTSANLIAVAAGGASSYALSSDGSLWVWGDNRAGELGLGTSTLSYNTPQHLTAPHGYIFNSTASSAEDALATLATVASIGDVNGDSKVNIADLGVLATNYGKSGTNLPGDINGDGAVDIADLGILATNYGYGTTGPQLSFADAEKAPELPAVPEPGMIGLIALAIPLSRRSRRRAS